MNRMIFLGPPNAGKGTIAARVVEKYKIPHVSTGHMFREAIKNKTPLGAEALKFINQGMLVPDHLTIEMVEERLEEPDCKNGFILDGFPRTIPQAESLGKKVKIDKVILIEAPEDVIIKRVTGRLQCKGCGAIYHKINIPPKKQGICDKCGGELYTRADDELGAVKERLRVYAEQTAPLVDYYEKKGILKRVDGGERPLDSIISDTMKTIDS